MGKADGLSRRLDWKVGVEKDNESQIFIKNNWICSLQEVVIEGPEVDILEKIKRARSKDKDVVRVVEDMKKAKVKELWENEWQIVVATTHRNGTRSLLTSAKLLVGYLVVGIYKRTQQGAFTILSTIYIHSS